MEKCDSDSEKAELRYLKKIAERNAAKILELDAHSITMRYELEQKRRGFALLAELAISLRNRASYESVFVSAARRINAALNMQRTAVLTPDGGKKGRFRASVLQGYPQDEKALIESRRITLDAELLASKQPVLVTGADPAGRLAEFREAVGIPYLISYPAFLYDNSVAALLVTGRINEEPPYLPRLGKGDAETVHAISSLLAAVLVEQALVDDLGRAHDLAEKSARAKGEFLANMSHEVHTPMNAILGMARLLSKSTITAQQRYSVEYIMQSARLLLRVFDDILDFSNLESGRIKLRAEPFSIRETADNVRAVAEEHAKKKSLSFDILVEPDVPDVILGDQVRIEQMLLNLTDNAVKFTNSGGVSVRVARQVSAPGNVMLLFEVQDTGIGMNAKDTESVFLPFTQADASYTRKYGGTGLGLALCRSLAELMRGEISCESRLGEGSKFMFSAPFELPGAEQGARSGEPVYEGGEFEALRGLRVLLVEDNKINQLITVNMLASVGADADVAVNGLEALRAVKNNEYDIILMDIQMPEMDGLTAAAHIRANPRHKDLPIVALTAHSLPEDREASLKSGMNDHLTKPVEPEQLYAALLPLVRRTGRRQNR